MNPQTDPKPLIEVFPTALLKVSKISTTTCNQSGVGDSAGQREAIISLATMQEGVFNASSDINGVIAAIGLDVGTGEGIADLKAVFPLTTKDETSRQLDQLGESCRCLGWHTA